MTRLTCAPLFPTMANVVFKKRPRYGVYKAMKVGSPYEKARIIVGLLIPALIVSALYIMPALFSVITFQQALN